MDIATGLREFHNCFGGVKWKLDENGVFIEGSGSERTKGEPATVTRVWEQYHEEICRWGSAFDIRCELILATICTESGGNAAARRNEPGFRSDDETPDRVSLGLMQTLISTARSVLNNEGIDAAWLLTPDNSIQAGAAYIAQQRQQTNLDPPRVACAYNAGGVYENDQPANRWKMKQYPIGSGEHCDRFVQWFNDAVYVLSQNAIKPAVSWVDFLNSLS